MNIGQSCKYFIQPKGNQILSISISVKIKCCSYFQHTYCIFMVLYFHHHIFYGNGVSVCVCVYIRVCVFVCEWQSALSPYAEYSTYIVQCIRHDFNAGHVYHCSFLHCRCIGWSKWKRVRQPEQNHINIYIFLCSKFCGYMHVSLRRFRTSFVCLYIYLYFDIILMWVWTLCSHLALVLFLLCYTYSNIYGYHKYIAIVVATTTVGNVVHWLTNQTYKYTLESTS